MKTLLIFSVTFCVALSIRAATVVPAEAAAVQQEGDEPAPKPEVDTDTAAVPHQARFQFCLPGWSSFRGQCYYLANHHDTWTNAESFCASFDGSLASVRNIWEYHFLQNMLRTGGHTFAWIGGYLFQDKWRWEDGSVFNYENWDSPGSTNHYQCLQVNSQDSKGWSNNDCMMSFPSICQVNPNC